MDQRIQKIEARMSQQDKLEAQQLEQEVQSESQYKLIQQINLLQKTFHNYTIYVSIIIGFITFIMQLLNYQPQLTIIWCTSQLLLFVHFNIRIKKIDKKLNNQELSQTLQQLAGDKQYMIHLLKLVQSILSIFAYFKNAILGIAISQSVFVSKIKKIIDDKEIWFEEIIQYYEEVIYAYDDPDELSLGQQMDLEQLIENYDVSDQCYEEIISVYEYDSEEQESSKQRSLKFQEDENNFQVQLLGEEEYIQIIDDDILTNLDDLVEETTMPLEETIIPKEQVNNNEKPPKVNKEKQKKIKKNKKKVTKKKKINKNKNKNKKHNKK